MLCDARENIDRHVDFDAQSNKLASFCLFSAIRYEYVCVCPVVSFLNVVVRHEMDVSGGGGVR